MEEDELVAGAAGVRVDAVGACGAVFDAGGVDLLMDEVGTAVRVDGVAVVRGVHDEVRPAEKLVLALGCRSCTSRSALQAKWNNRVIELYSL